MHDRRSRIWIAAVLLYASSSQARDRLPAAVEPTRDAYALLQGAEAANEQAAEVGPDVAMSQLMAAFGKGDCAAMWNALPPRCRTDLQSLKNALVEKIEPELWDRAMPVVRKLAVVAKEKKDLFASSAMFKSMVPAERKNMVLIWDPFFDFFIRVVDSPVGTHEGLRTTEVEQLLVPVGNAVFATWFEHLDKYEPAVHEAMEKIRDGRFTIVRQDDATATLQYATTDEEPIKHEMVKLDGKWVSREFAESWDKQVGIMRAAIEAVRVSPELKAQILAVAPVLDAACNRLKVTRDQNSFDAQMMSLAFKLGPIIQIAGKKLP